MAIAFDATSKAEYAGGQTSQTVSHTCSGSARLLLVAVLSNGSNTDNISGVTYNGVAMTRLTSITPSSGGGFFWALYYMIDPPTGAHDIVATVSSSAGMITMGSSYTGVKQTGFPDAQVTSSQDNRTTYTQALTSIVDNCWFFSAVCQNTYWMEPSTGVTERNSQSTKYRIVGDSNGPKVTAGSYSMSYTTPAGAVGYNTGWIMISFAPSLTNDYTTTLTEVIKIVPTMLRIAGKLQSAAIVIVSTMLKTTGKLRLEAIIIVSTMLKTSIKLFNEVLKVVPLLASILTSFKTLTQSIIVNSNATKAMTKPAFTETIKVVDMTVTALKIVTAAFVEVVKVVDQTVLKTLSAFKTLTQSIIIVPTMTRVISLLKTLTETIKVVDDFMSTFIRMFSERIVVLAIGIRTVPRIFTDSVIVVANFSRGALQKVFVETIIVIGVFGRLITRIFTQSIIIVGVVVKSTPKIITSVIKVVGTMSNPTIGKLLRQTLTIVPKLRLVLNGLQVGLWAKIRRISTGAWSKISRHE